MSNEERIRKKQLHLYITDDEYKILQDKSEYANMNTSSYIRSMIVNGKIVVDNSYTETIVKMAELSNMINDYKYEINKIGNNINQLVKIIHENNDLYFDEQIQEAVNMIKNVGKTFDELTKVMYEKLYDL